MPWSITISCIGIVLILCQVCDRLLQALRTPKWAAVFFLALIALCEILPSFTIGSYILLKPYGALLLLTGAALLLAGADMITMIRGLAGAFACCCVSLAVLWFVPTENHPEVIMGLAVALTAFATGFTADGTLIAIFLGVVSTELTMGFMYLPFFEMGTEGFLGSACIAAVPALILCRIFAHNSLKEKQRQVDRCLSALRRNQMYEISSPYIDPNSADPKDALEDYSEQNDKQNDEQNNE